MTPAAISPNVRRDRTKGLNRTAAQSRARLPLLLALVVGWMAVIYYLSSRPPLPLAGVRLGFITLGKLGHLGEYAILAALLALSFQEAWARLRESPLTAAMSAMTVATLYGASDEYHQAFVPGRTASAKDVGFDAAGAAAGILFWLVLRSFRRREASPRYNAQETAQREGE